MTADKPADPQAVAAPRTASQCGCQCHGPYVWDICYHCQPELIPAAAPSEPLRAALEPCPVCGGEAYDRIYRDEAGISRHCGADMRTATLQASASEATPQPDLDLATWQPPRPDFSKPPAPGNEAWRREDVQALAAPPAPALDECPCGHSDDEHVHYCAFGSGDCECAAEYARLSAAAAEGTDAVER